MIVGVAIGCGAIVLGLVLIAVASFYVAQARLQQAADIAAASLAANPGDRPGERAQHLARANGARSMSVELKPDGTRVVVVHGRAPGTFGIAAGGKLRATAIVPEPATPAFGTAGAPAGIAPGGHGMYAGPLVHVDSTVICPRVGADYRAMQQAAAVDGIALWANSGFRTDAEQAVIYAQLGPGIAAPPGTSLHRYATELDINTGPAGSSTHLWLTANAGRFHFVQRYSCE